MLQLLFLLALTFTVLSFSMGVDKFGRVFFMFFASITWFAFGIAQLKIKFMEGGSIGMVFYNFTMGSDNTPPELVYLYLGLGLLLFIIAIIRAISLVYGPVISGAGKMTGAQPTEYTRL